MIIGLGGQPTGVNPSGPSCGPITVGSPLAQGSESPLSPPPPPPLGCRRMIVGAGPLIPEFLPDPPPSPALPGNPPSPPSPPKPPVPPLAIKLYWFRSPSATVASILPAGKPSPPGPPGPPSVAS